MVDLPLVAPMRIKPHGSDTIRNVSTLKDAGEILIDWPHAKRGPFYQAARETVEAAMNGKGVPPKPRRHLARYAIMPAWWPDRAIRQLSSTAIDVQVAETYISLFGRASLNNRMRRIKTKILRRHQHQNDHDGDRGKNCSSPGNISHDQFLSDFVS